MPKLGLRPFASIQNIDEQLREGLDQYMGYNFARIENVFDVLTDTVAGVSTVTGSATINTGLAVVEGVVANFRTDPAAGAAFISCAPGGSGQISIRVLTNAFALSIIAVSIQWVAFGELVLS